MASFVPLQPTALLSLNGRVLQGAVLHALPEMSYRCARECHYRSRAGCRVPALPSMKILALLSLQA